MSEVFIVIATIAAVGLISVFVRKCIKASVQLRMIIRRALFIRRRYTNKGRIIPHTLEQRQQYDIDQYNLLRQTVILSIIFPEIAQ